MKVALFSGFVSYLDPAMASWPNLSRVSQKFHQLSHLRTTLAPVLQPQRPRPQGPRAELGRAKGHMALDPPQSAVEHLVWQKFYDGLAKDPCSWDLLGSVVHGIPFLPKPTGINLAGMAQSFLKDLTYPDLLLYWLYGSKWSDSQIGPWPLPQHLAVGQWMRQRKMIKLLQPWHQLAPWRTSKLAKSGKRMFMLLSSMDWFKGIFTGNHRFSH